MADIAKLTDQILQLPEHRLKELALAEEIYDAVLQAKSIASHGAAKRQKKYITQLLSQADLSEVKATLAHWGSVKAKSVHLFHLAERWRDRIVADSNAAEAFYQCFPHVDKSKLSMVTDKLRQSPGKAVQIKRELFRIIMDTLNKNPP